MCGIAGTINLNINTNSIMNLLLHRGPDEQSSYQFKHVNLIHTRLSIQDISHGQQPFEYRNYVMVFNGEIYNHLSLRKNYLKEFAFRTNSDTETLLYLYIKYRNNMFDMVDGMFAFAILDKDLNKIVLCRDRAGKKPLYVYKDKINCMFSSELNTIKGTLPSLEINEDEISAYLRNGFFYKDKTPYKNVFECEPGFIYEVNINDLKIKKNKYFEMLDFYKKDKITDFDYALNKVDDILHTSIKDRLLSSDLEVGAFLSGGIDSSLIVAIASEYTKKLKTFTVKFDGNFDESYLAKLTASKYKTNHHELSISMNLKNDVEKILLNYGEPFMDSSAIPTYYVSREAKKYVTVILNGDGADEIFGGYRRYVPIANNWLNIASYFSYLLKVLPLPNNKKFYYNYFYRLLSMTNKHGLEFYNSATNDIFEDVYKFKNNNTFDDMNRFIKCVDQENISDLSKMLYIDFKLILQNDLLKKMDIGTMSNSLEGRSPFLSKYMLEFIPTLSDKFKINKLNTKHILRELSKKYLPPELISQPKRGFEVPLKDWVENDLKEIIFDNLSSSYCENFVERSFIKKLLNKKINISDEKRAKILWTLVSLEIWYKNNTNLKASGNFVKSESIFKKTNILQLTTGLGLGGAEKVVYDISKHIDKRFSIKVVSLTSQDMMLNKFKNNLIDTYILNTKKSFKDIIKTISYLHNFIWDNKIDIIHAHMFHTIILSSVLKIFNFKIKIIFTPHNTYVASIFRQIIIYLLRPFRTVDTVFSKNMKSFFHKRNYVIIPNGINNQDYTIEKIKHKVFTFVIIGRLEKMKNHEFLIDIISEMDEYEFKLIIVGSGILENHLKQKVDKLNLNNKIDFLGARDDVPDILSSCDCLLLPSLWEAFPIVLLEAGVSSIPLITTPVGSIPSFVNEDNGYIVELKDFKKAMIEVFENYECAIKKAKRLNQLINNKYDIKNVVKKYENLYESCINGS